MADAVQDSGLVLHALCWSSVVVSNPMVRCSCLCTGKHLSLDGEQMESRGGQHALTIVVVVAMFCPCGPTSNILIHVDGSGLVIRLLPQAG